MKNDEKLDRLCLLYGKLDDEKKGKLIRLGEELLNSDNYTDDDILSLNTKNENGVKSETGRFKNKS